VLAASISRTIKTVQRAHAEKRGRHAKNLSRGRLITAAGKRSGGFNPSEEETETKSMAWLELEARPVLVHVAAVFSSPLTFWF
jgi:hypothetical protein